MSKNFSFNNVPVIRHSRSRFNLSHGVKTSGNVGTLYPFLVQEVVPGDTFKVKANFVSRLTSTFLKPVVDNLFLDMYFFFVPSRLLYDKWVNIFGENTDSAWANSQEYDVPKIYSGYPQSKTLADYMGLPVGSSLSNPSAISILPFRAFAKIYNEWFRDQNNIDPMNIQTGETVSSEILNVNAWSPSNYTGKPPQVAKFHDYFTSCLPSPQKGDATSIPLGTFAPLDVSPDGSVHDFSGAAYLGGVDGTSLDNEGIFGWSGNNSDGNLGVPVAWNGTSPGGTAEFINQSNLGVDLSQASGVTVNDLRFAFAFQKMLERDARSGTRYVEYISSHFGVQAGDYRLQRSEYLGGRRVPISITQVVQSTGSDSDTAPLGQVAGYSLSGGKSRFTKSFVEHGYIFGVYCIRQHHSYQQGIERFWSRFKRTDFYDPVFANIGEQPVYTRELYGGADYDTVFGYNEAWADMRYRPNIITGQMRSGVTDSLDIWHFGDNYSNAPVLGKTFIEETAQYVDRTISVESSAQDQFLLDFWIDCVAYRPMPTYSIPSLIDHN